MNDTNTSVRACEAGHKPAVTETLGQIVERDRASRGRRLMRRIGALAAGVALLAIGVGGTALADLTTARGRVVNTLDPAAFHASQLQVDLLNQETGVRGYALSAQLPFLKPYHDGLSGQQQQVATLRPLLAGMSAAGSPSPPVAVTNRYPLARSRVMICGSARTVWLRFPPASCIMITAPRPPRGMAAATILATPGRAQSRVSTVSSTIR